MLAGEARVRVAPSAQRPGPIGDGESVIPLPDLRTLPIRDQGTGTRTTHSPVQVFRISLPRTPCRVPFTPDASKPAFVGATVAVQGPLEGRVQRPSFAPAGLWPLRHAQSWPLMGSAPELHPNSVGAFEFGPALPGLWARPFQSYFSVGVGSLDAKAAVDFARPEPASATALSWTQSKPFQAAARVTDNDNFGRWQLAALGASVWFTLGGAVLAALAFEWLRPSRSDELDQPASHEARAGSPSESQSHAEDRRRQQRPAGGWFAAAVGIAFLVRDLRGSRKK